MTLDPFDALAVADALGSSEPALFRAGVRALAQAVRAGDAYDVPLPARDALPGFLAGADADAAEELLSLLTAHGAFLPPATPADLWAWGGPLLVRLGNVRLGLRLAIDVRTAADPVAALRSVLSAADETPGPWTRDGLSTFLDTVSTAGAPLPEVARAELDRRAADPRYAPFLGMLDGGR
jgi:hypothetical protein